MTVSIRLSPNASCNRIETADAEGRIKVRVTAKPVENAANEALVVLFAKALGVSKSSVSLKHGQTSRNKVIEILGITQLPESIYGKTFR